MDISTIFKKASQVITDNSPAILTVMGAVGVISTAVMAARGHANATRIVEYREDVEERKYDLREKVQLTWKHYIPATVMGATSIACIIGANHINVKRNAAIISAYSIAEASLKEYKDKVIEVVGEGQATKIRDEIAKDHIQSHPINPTEIIITGSGDSLCYDQLTGRYFRSSIEKIRKAQNDINSEIINNMYASQNDFYRLIGLDPISIGDDLGWNNDHLLDIQYSSILTPDDEPALHLQYRHQPIRGYCSAF